MNLFKRLTSTALAMVMVVTMFSMGLTTEASISQSKENITINITVPETIYLAPGTRNMQYYIAGSPVGETPSPTKNSIGGFSFSVSKPASSISVSCTTASILAVQNDPNISQSDKDAYTAGLSGTVTPLSVSNTTSMSGSVSSGVAPSTNDDVLIWTFDYTIDGVAYSANAYSYIYSPYLGQTGAMGATVYQTTIGNEPKLTVYSFIVGIHSTSGGTYQSNFVGTGNDTFMSPLISGWSDSNVPQAETEYYSLDTAFTYFTELSDATGGVTYVDAWHDRSTSNDRNYGNYDGCGVLTVDASRYAGASFSDIPNFAGGVMLYGSLSSSKKHECSSFTATGGSNTITFSTGFDYANEARGKAYGLFYPTDSLPNPLVDTKYNVDANYSMRRSNSSSCNMYYHFGLQILVVNKGTLRTKINEAISANYQQADYDADAFASFKAALQNAACVLGNPVVTQNDIQNALDSLNGAQDNMLRYHQKTFTATVTHRLPASDGFKYTYDGVEYTASGGYVTITEQQTFPSSSEVTIGTNEFTGYTITADSQTFTKRRSDISKTYTYTPIDSKIYFDYVHPDHVIGGTGIAELTVSYGSKYGTFPTPAIDGWTFGGWNKTGTTTAVIGDTFCTMIGGRLDLTAQWTCNFSGGFGTQGEPFLISNMSDLDNIDNIAVYKINNGANGTTGKYYKQSANINFSFSSAPVLVFGGVYEGNNKTLTVPSSITIQSASYGSIFGAVSDATIRNLVVDIQGKMMATGSSGYVGFIGNATGVSVDNIQITFNGTLGSGTNSGILAGKATNSTITNSAVDIQSGTVGGDAFIGSRSGGTLRNTWALVADGVTVSHSNANNILRVRENGSASISCTGTQYQYIFTAYPNSGWMPEYRDASETVIASENGQYLPAAALTGKEYYLCFTKNMTFSAGAHGTLTGAGTYSLRQGQTVTGINPVAESGYRFESSNGWTLTGGANGTFSGSGPYTYTMGTAGGAATANFTVNRYKVIYDKNTTGSVTVPATAWYDADQPITILPPADRPGWTFNGWNTLANGAGNGYVANQQYGALSKVNEEEITLFAQWTQNHYTVTFITNGGSAVTNKTDAVYGESVEFPTSTKIGYKNLMWYLDAEAAMDNTGGYQPGTTRQIYDSITYYAGWTPITYSIVFSATGASNVPSPQFVQYDSGAFVIPASFVPIRAGYVFMGWDTQAAGNGIRYQVTKSIPGNQSTVDGDVITLYAQWEAAKFNVTWDLTGGEIDGNTVDPVTVVTFGEKYILPTGNVTQDTKAFRGWYTQAEGGVMVSKDSTVTITADTRFYAQWDPAVYSVEYNGNGGTGTVQTQDVTYGQLSFAFQPNAFTRPGYTFKEWNTQPDGSGIGYQPGVTPGTDLTVGDGDVVTMYAIWTGDTFTIAYEVYGVGNAMMTNTVKMEGNSTKLRSRTTAVTLANDVHIDGTYNSKYADKAPKDYQAGKYTFGGWAYSYEDEANLVKAYDGGASFALTDEVLSHCDYDLNTHTITLHAIWLRENTITWNLVGGNYDGDSTNPTTTVVRGNNYVLPTTDPVRPRHIFSNWYSTVDASTGIQITNSLKLNENADQTVYARWVSNGNMTSSYQTWYYKETFTRGVYGEPERVTSIGDLGLTDPIQAEIKSITGFTFVHVYGEDGEVLSGMLTDDQEEEQLILKVFYARNYHTLTFTDGFGNVLSSEEKPYGFSIAVPQVESREGYTWIGWTSTVPATMPDNDVTIDAAWSISTYTLTLTDGFGGTIFTESYAFGDEIPAQANPHKDGYQFNGWSSAIPETMPSHNVTIAATWSPNTYYVNFNANGGEGTMSSQSFVFNTSAKLNPNVFTKNGYNFAGWGTSAQSTTASYSNGGTFTMSDAGDVTLYAVWSPKMYALTFTDGYGVTILTTQIAYGAAVSAGAVPEPPQKDGHEFLGWDRDIPTTMPAENVTINAVWSKNAYTLLFTDGFGETISSAEYAFGATIENVPAAPSKEGFLFDGWSSPIPATMPARDVTIDATWKRNTYTLTLTDGFGKTILTETFTFEQEIPVQPDPSKEGYTFNGWSEAIPSAMPAHNVTINATWIAKVYEITFKANGGDGTMANQAFAYNATSNLNENTFTKLGYSFAGWGLSADSTSATYSNGGSFTLNAPENVTLYALWTPHTYYIAFIKGDDSATGEMPTMLCTYDTVSYLPENRFSRTGAHFLGWMKKDMSGAILADQAEILNLTTNDKETIELVAQWDNILYTMHYNLGGGTSEVPLVDKTDCICNSVVTLPSASGLHFRTSSEVRTFRGWMIDGVFYAPGANFTVPAWNVTVLAVWSANYYEVERQISIVEGYMESGMLPANETHDASYALGGDWANRLSSGGQYQWSDFDTTALDAAYEEAKKSANQNLPADQQNAVDALAQAISDAFSEITLLDADRTIRYACTHKDESEMDEYTGKRYPACESRNRHSFDSLLALIETVVNTPAADSLYTAASVNALSRSANAIAQAFAGEELKKPAQSEVEVYVDRLSQVYHTTLVLKDADYSAIETLKNTYLPQTKQAAYDNLDSYYTAESVANLKNYYTSTIVWTYKITRQEEIDDVFYPGFQDKIDKLIPLRADYRNVFEQILNIPKSNSFSYPSTDVTDPAWMTWATANAGKISEAIDKTYLDQRFEAPTVNALNRVLDSIDWNLDVFSQDTINVTPDVSYVARLSSAIGALVRRTYSIVYLLNDGTGSAFTTFSGKFYGDLISMPTGEPTRNGYVFRGWSYDPETLDEISASDTITGDTMIYAIWSFNCASVIFDLNGGTGTAPAMRVVEIGETITLPGGDGFEMEDRVFAGWSEDPAATNGVKEFTPTVKGEVTLYAVWAALSVQLIPHTDSTTVIDEESKTIYGLTLSLDENKLVDEYLDLEGNGEIEVIYNTYVGTGSTVVVVNLSTGQVDAEYQVVIFGDVDGDGIVTTEDVRLIKGHVSGAGTLTDTAQLMAADMDGDGVVSMQDAILMKSLISGAQRYDQAGRQII